MPTNNPRTTIVWKDADELEGLRKKAIKGESDSNLIRRLLKLKPLSHGGVRKTKKE